VIQPSYEALLIDLDGTLVDDRGEIRPRTLAGLQALDEKGRKVMVATGRSVGGARPVLEQLGFETLAVICNGAGLYCPRRHELVEERVLSNRTVESALSFARAEGLLPVTMRFRDKFAPPPRDEVERRALAWLEDLHTVPLEELPTADLMRITLFSERHGDSAAFCAEVQAAIEQPVYVTHFPLKALCYHRESPLQVVDVQPPCRGKAEGLRVLSEEYGIPPERVVAIGDAENDLPMLQGAGLGVAMRNAMPSVLQAADRVIGDNNSDAIAELLTELFGI
jgi:Cof subfamily protein (haloacid dehalogenase superfamily)